MSDEKARRDFEEIVKYRIEKDGVSRTEAIEMARRDIFMVLLSTLDEKDRCIAIKEIEKVGGI